MAALKIPEGTLPKAGSWEKLRSGSSGGRVVMAILCAGGKLCMLLKVLPLSIIESNFIRTYTHSYSASAYFSLIYLHLRICMYLLSKEKKGRFIVSNDDISQRLRPHWVWRWRMETRWWANCTCRHTPCSWGPRTTATCHHSVLVRVNDLWSLIDIFIQ